MRTDAASQCISCHEAWVSAARLGALVGAFFTMLGAYNFLLLTHPAALKNWVATGSIIIAHLQTVSIVARLRLAWPASAQLAFQLSAHMQLAVAVGATSRVACMASKPCVSGDDW